MKCTQSDTVRYLDWTATLTNDTIGTPILQISIVNVESLFPEVVNDLVPSNYSTRFVLACDAPSSSVVASNSSAFFFGGFNFLLYSQQRISFTISNINSTTENIVLYNQQHTLVLVYREMTLLSPELPAPSPWKDVSPEVVKAADVAANVSRYSLGATAGAVVIASTFSFNFGPAFIKLFQIIEILGKLYFTPVEFSPYLDFFLNKIYALSDLISFNRNIFMKEQLSFPNNSYYKLTNNSIPKDILRSISVAPVTYLALKLLSALLRRCHSPQTAPQLFKSRLIFLLSFLTQPVFELNFVDFIFFSAYSLLGPLSASLLTSPLYLVNKLISLVVLFDCTCYVCGIVGMAGSREWVSNCGNEVVRRAQREVVLEGIKDKYLSRRSVRMFNSIFHMKLILYMVLIVATLHCIIGVVFLIFFSLLSTIYLLLLQITLDPFEGWISNLQKLSFEICLTCFFIGVGTKLVNLHHIYFDYGLMVLTAVCVISQLFYAINYTVGVIKNLCKPKLRSRKSSDSSASLVKILKKPLAKLPPNKYFLPKNNSRLRRKLLSHTVFTSHNFNDTLENTSRAASPKRVEAAGNVFFAEKKATTPKL